MYKKALNSFFLKVHPDFFHQNREQQVVNENSVAQLNELLSWAREFKAGTLRPPPSTSISFTFYRRIDSMGDSTAYSLDKDEGDGRGGSSSFASRGFAPESEGSSIRSTFELPEGFTASEANRGMVERSVNKFLRDLLRRAGCIDSVTESVSAAEDATAARMEAKPLRKRSGPQRKKEKVTKPKSLLDEATETMSMRWTLTPTPTMEELMEADQVLFSRELSPLQCSAAMNTLRTHLGELRYEYWESMPLIVSDRFAIGEVTGSLTVPWDFTAVQFVSFLAHNEEAIGKCREDALGFATTVERLISELCATLELDDVLISCAHTDAHATLRLLVRNKDLLYGYGLSNITLEIGNRCATRANGVVIVSHSIQTIDKLREWLNALQPKLDIQKKLYKLSKHMLETTMWHLKQFREMVEPAGIDAFDSSGDECTYAQRLEWSKELFRIGASLTQWDWSEFTFTLSPELDIDWEHRQIALPYNFDGDALVRYVEEIQQQAKKQKREALLRESAAQRQKEHEERERAHARELLQSSSDRNGGEDHHDSSGSEVRPDISQGQGGDMPGAAQLRDMYRRTSPHLEEYLTSSDDRVDTLTVERPLSHAVSFNSDDEAKDQLLWEGFYQEPVVDQVPTGDIDDVAHTYFMTNRWHREEAAKKLLEELKSTYGKKSRRFDYQKMGDVLEINNARVQPKGFPVLARGVKPGSST